MGTAKKVLCQKIRVHLATKNVGRVKKQSQEPAAPFNPKQENLQRRELEILPQEKEMVEPEPLSQLPVDPPS